jgi:hypothetical protein
MILVGSDRFWCPETPQFVVAVSPESVIVAGHSHLFEWKVPSGELLRTWPRDPQSTSPRSHSMMSEDGKLRASCDFSRQRISLVALDEERELGPTDQPTAISWDVALAGDFLASNFDGGTGIWDVNIGALVKRLDGRVISGHGDGFVLMGQSVQRVNARGEILSQIELPFDRRTSIGCATTDARGRHCAATFECAPGGLMMVALPNVYLFDLERRELRTLSTEGDHHRLLALSPDGERLAVWDDDGLHIHALAGDWPILSRLKTPDLDAMTFSPDGKRLVVHGEEGLSLLEGDKLIARGAGGRMLGWSHLGLICAGVNSVELHDAETLVRKGTLIEGTPAAFALDGDRYAYSLGDGFFRVMP